MSMGSRRTPLSETLKNARLKSWGVFQGWKRQCCKLASKESVIKWAALEKGMDSHYLVAVNTRIH